jgi:hypothetical protein
MDAGDRGFLSHLAGLTSASEVSADAGAASAAEALRATAALLERARGYVDATSAPVLDAATAPVVGAADPVLASVGSHLRDVEALIARLDAPAHAPSPPPATGISALEAAGYRPPSGGGGGGGGGAAATGVSAAAAQLRAREKLAHLRKAYQAPTSSWKRHHPYASEREAPALTPPSTYTPSWQTFGDSRLRRERKRAEEAATARRTAIEAFERKHADITAALQAHLAARQKAAFAKLRDDVAALWQGEAARRLSQAESAAREEWPRLVNAVAVDALAQVSTLQWGGGGGGAGAVATSPSGVPCGPSHAFTMVSHSASTR